MRWRLVGQAGRLAELRRQAEGLAPDRPCDPDTGYDPTTASLRLPQLAFRKPAPFGYSTLASTALIRPVFEVLNCLTLG